MALYEKLGRVNILPQIKARFPMDMDGKIRIPLRMELNTPWIYNGRDPKRCCSAWGQVFFSVYHVLPWQCLHCWKVHYRPKTLRELMDIYRWQMGTSRQIVDISCKSGIETRAFTGNLGGYATFWYNPLGCGLAEARRNTHLLSEALEKPLGLKRGCTEMEQFTRRHFGFGSDEWEKVVTPYSRMKQELLEATFEFNGKEPERTPAAVAVDVTIRWIEHAAEHGDRTYLDFVDGPFFPKPDEYKGSIHKPGDFKSEELPDVTYTDGFEQEADSGKACRAESLLKGLEKI